jgi:uncharacterized protein YjbJ (UPF0337 family)
MSNASKRGEGAVEELGGKIKQTVGAILGNDKMEAEGHAKKVQGHGKQEAAKASERVKGKVEEIKAEARQKANA